MRDDDSDNLRRRAWKVREAVETASKQKAAWLHVLHLKKSG